MPQRIITSIIVLLIIGAAINVIVAWACVVLAKTRMFNAVALGRLRAAQYDREDALAAAGRMPEAERYLALLFLAPGSRVLMVDETEGDSSIRRGTQSAGWPMLALEAEQVLDRRKALSTRWGVAAGRMILDYPQLPIGMFAPPALPAPATRPMPGRPPPPAATMVAVTGPSAAAQTAERLLPMRPLWPGFALNTIIFALAAWLLWLTFVGIMRTQRRLRGRCGRCAYPIGSSPVCTECGGRVHPRLAPAKLSA